ncbi:hypothetical protein FRX31_028477, partial [Thalictrum thalictroides]
MICVSIFLEIDPKLICFFFFFYHPDFSNLPFSVCCSAVFHIYKGSPSSKYRDCKVYKAHSFTYNFLNCSVHAFS